MDKIQKHNWNAKTALIWIFYNFQDDVHFEWSQYSLATS